MVVISLARNRPSLAIGNVVGSTISNILGAFSLGLFFYKNSTGNPVLFEQSSTVYSLALLGVTAMASALLAFGRRIDWKATGGAFIGLFVLYIASVSYLIAKGITKAPEELSDSDSSSDATESGGENVIGEEDHHHMEAGTHPERPLPSNSSNGQAPVPVRAPDDDEMIVLAALTAPQLVSSGSGANDLTGPSIPVDLAQGEQSNVMTPGPAAAHAEETSSLARRRRQGSSHRPSIDRRSTRSTSSTAHIRKPKVRSVAYHVAMLGAGLGAVIISGYVLSNAASNIVDEFGISDVLGGVVILSIATTIPEKFVAVLSGHKGHIDLVLANTVGSNLFLLTLCIGIIWVAAGGTYAGGDLVPAEIAVMFGSTVVLAVIVLWLGRFAKFCGGAMLLGYVAFIVLEFAVFHKV